MINNNKRNNILVTESDSKRALGIVRALGKINLNPYVLTQKKHSLAGLSKFCKGEILISKDENDGDLINKLINHHIDHVIPIGIKSYQDIYNIQEKLDRHNIKYALPARAEFERCISKYETYKLAKELGIPVPKSWKLSETVSLESVLDQVTYPIVFKAEEELGISIVKYANSNEEIKTVIQHTLNEFPDMTIADFIIQEYIEGEGFGFFAVYSNGQCGKTFQHHRIRQFPATGGASVAAESVHEEKLELYGKRILDHLNWHGVAMVEFKKTTEGQFVLLEVNPKFWGSIDLALEAGVNFPYEIIQINNGKEIAFERNYKFPFKYCWPLDGDFMYMKQRPEDIGKVLKDFVSPNVKTNLWLSDIAPTIRLYLAFIKKLIKSIL